MENEVFGLARENKEMAGDEKEDDEEAAADGILEENVPAKQVEEGFANHKMIKKIELMEDQMAGGRSWQMGGEVQSKQRPLNSLLAEHLDFNLGVKLPPTISKDVTTNLESQIKQRILDELFDDPIRKADNSKNKKDGDDDEHF
jgi:U3 small nucleolar RNA-associated protein MPP10